MINDPKRIRDIDYSVIVPVYNGEKTVQPLFLKISEVFKELGKSYQVIFVEDCGRDKSWQKILELKKEHPETVTAIKLTANFGQHSATFCGMDHADGKHIITIDDDLQIPPEEIPRLITAMENDDNPDLVYGVFPKKKHSAVRNFGSAFLKKFTHIFFKAPGKGSSFRLFTKDLSQHVLQHRSSFVFLDELLLWYTGNISFVEVSHRERENSASGYSIFKLIRLFFSVILYSTVTPLKIMIYGGFFFSMVNLILGSYFVYKKIFYNVPLGYTSIIVTILFSTSILLFFLGVIGKYLSRIYMIQNKRPPYLIKHKYK